MEDENLWVWDAYTPPQKRANESNLPNGRFYFMCFLK